MESMSIPGSGSSRMARRDPADNHLVVESCTILTTEANPLIQSIHHRMPVILGLKEIDLWLDPQKDPAKLKEIL
jgi:putative SOS response-associated peptidase YedK